MTRPHLQRNTPDDIREKSDIRPMCSHTPNTAKKYFFLNEECNKKYSISILLHIKNILLYICDALSISIRGKILNLKIVSKENNSFISQISVQLHTLYKDIYISYLYLYSPILKGIFHIKKPQIVKTVKSKTTYGRTHRMPVEFPTGFV